MNGNENRATWLPYLRKPRRSSKIVASKLNSILQFTRGLRAGLHVTWEEGGWLGWDTVVCRISGSLRLAFSSSRLDDERRIEEMS